MSQKDNTKILYLLIALITLAFLVIQYFLYEYIQTDTVTRLASVSYVICSCILLGFLIIYYKSNNEELRKRIYLFSENILHKYWKGEIARELLILVYIASTVLVGWFCVTILKYGVTSEMHAGAFAGAFFGALFVSVIEMIKRTIDNWDDMTPLRYLKRFFLFLLIGLFSLVGNNLFVLIQIKLATNQ